MTDSESKVDFFADKFANKIPLSYPSLIEFVSGHAAPEMKMYGLNLLIEHYKERFIRTKNTSIDRLLMKRIALHELKDVVKVLRNNASSHEDMMENLKNAFQKQSTGSPTLRNKTQNSQRVRSENQKHQSAS